MTHIHKPDCLLRHSIIHQSSNIFANPSNTKQRTPKPTGSIIAHNLTLPNDFPLVPLAQYNLNPTLYYTAPDPSTPSPPFHKSGTPPHRSHHNPLSKQQQVHPPISPPQLKTDPKNHPPACSPPHQIHSFQAPITTSTSFLIITTCPLTETFSSITLPRTHAPMPAQCTIMSVEETSRT